MTDEFSGSVKVRHESYLTSVRVVLYVFRDVGHDERRNERDGVRVCNRKKGGTGRGNTGVQETCVTW